jgi:hypothetical protein
VSDAHPRAVVTPASVCQRSLPHVDGGTADGGPAVTKCWSELESGGGGHHRRPPGVHRRDDLLGVDALQVNRGRAEVGVAELALDDVERHAFAGDFDGVGVAQLMRRKTPPHIGLGG